MPDSPDYAAYKRRLARILGLYIAGVCLLLLLLAWAEQHGLSRQWLGPVFLFSTVMVYAGIGIYGRTSNPGEYYVAGRRIPPFYNGMAAAADWMSAASFISLAGGLYLQGFSGSQGSPGGLAYLLGWTGGFCLVGLLVAPYLRSLRLFTVPDYFAVRYGGRWPRLLAAFAAVLCSFTYVVAQIYGIGLIASRLTGVQYEIGILLGLGGVLLCSFLGGMRAITWTQVAQYVILLLAFLIPVSWLSYKQLGSPLAPLAYGAQIQKITELERDLRESPAERQVQAEYQRRAAQYESWLADVAPNLERERSAARERIRQLKATNADSADIVAAGRELAALPRDIPAARELWTNALKESRQRAQPLGGLPPHAQPFAGDPNGDPSEQAVFRSARLNFLALVFCLMAGTAGMPHLLTRFYTTPSVREARSSVAWALFFVVLLYLSVPALAVLVKYELMHGLVGTSFGALPPWIIQWEQVDPALLSVRDVNADGLVQFGEIRLGADIIMLATPEIAGLPYVVSGLVAAGGVAAALSTADALLLTISNAMVRDIYFQDAAHPEVSPERRVILSKFALLAVALVAAMVASFKPADILALVSASFSLAAAAFVPALVLGIFWRGTTRAGAVCGMVCGLSVTIYYMVVHAPAVRQLTGIAQAELWFGILPGAAGVFGVALGFVITATVSLVTHGSD